MLKYRLINADWKLILTDSVLNHFAKHKQLSDKQTEAGGQLFAYFRGGEVWIERVTGPRHTDKRTRYSYSADNKLEQLEINRQFKAKLHYVGDWHTHPEPIPVPSQLDLTNIRNCFRQSTHELKGFIMLIVGTANYPEGIHLSLNNENSSEVFVVFEDENQKKLVD